MELINVDIPGAEYQVTVDRDAIEKIATDLAASTKNRQVLIVADAFFEELYVKKIEKSLIDKGFVIVKFIMKGGKISKTFNEVLKLYGLLEEHNFARDGTLIAMGGGVIGDLAGFVASTWYRGMNLIHIPTTLMAMVDSSIGGKVAINFRETINAVGNYHHPIANYMDINLIDSLSQRDYVSGLAEVIKCALIADEELFDYLQTNKEQILARSTPHLVHCIKRAIEIKVDHVKNDVREGGKRLKLNFGHTLGHAIEMATQSDEGELFRHGEGVSLGMSAILELSHFKVDLSQTNADKVVQLLKDYSLPISFSASEHGFERAALIQLCMKLALRDKKRQDNALRFILLDTIGTSSIHGGGAPDEQIKIAFEAVIKD